MYKAMDSGKKVRRPCWNPSAYMKLNNDGIEETYIDDKIVALGFRSFDDLDVNDYEIVD
jgi:hypothetical protein